MFSVPLWHRHVLLPWYLPLPFTHKPHQAVRHGGVCCCVTLSPPGSLARYSSTSNLYPTPYTEWINSTSGSTLAIFFRSFLIWLSMVRSLTVRWS